MNILLVEDKDGPRELLKMLLENEGFEVDVAPNGYQAVTLTKRNVGKYDICLMDTEMPIMNGPEAIKIIRQELEFYFPIISMSANHDYEKKCLASGANDFLKKPCNPEIILGKINELGSSSIK